MLHTFTLTARALSGWTWQHSITIHEIHHQSDYIRTQLGVIFIEYIPYYRTFGPQNSKCQVPSLLVLQYNMHDSQEESGLQTQQKFQTTIALWNKLKQTSCLQQSEFWKYFVTHTPVCTMQAFSLTMRKTSQICEL